MMNILLTGVNYNNKGAELMLRAMVQHFRTEFSEAKLVCGFYGSYENRVKEGLYQLAKRSRGRVTKLFEFLPKKTRKEWGIVLPKEIHVVIDASGFAFGDQWSEQYVRSEATRCLNCKKYGSRLVLMPQAFGPFTNTAIREVCTELFVKADLIFPRDKESYTYVCDLIPQSHISGKVHLAPDFTNLVQGFVPQSFSKKELQGAVGILPNEKMLTKKGEMESQKYIDFLNHVLQVLENKNVPHFVLCHQNEDQKVVDLLKLKLKTVPPIIAESNALFIKGVLGTCRFLIGSRFHGLVNGLSQGVPCICTSWSHKYEALFADYHCSQYLVSDLSAFDQVDDLIENLLDESTYQSMCQMIEMQSLRLKEETRVTWKIVDDFIRNAI